MYSLSRCGLPMQDCTSEASSLDGGRAHSQDSTPTLGATGSQQQLFREGKFSLPPQGCGHLHADILQ